MTDLTTILDRSFLEFLQERLARLFKGKVSVVFEDLQSRPITGKFPKTRVFARRAEELGGNVCQSMIDCPLNEKAQLKCLLSDTEGAHMARTHKKGYFYRCHQGRGFPNLLFPIMIWPDEVIGYLYVGQIVFQKLENGEREKFLKRLRESDYKVENPERFISEWNEPDLLDFYEYIIEPGLRKDCNPDTFSESILKQVKNYGVSPDEFFDIVELVERLANELSTLGNSLYLLNSLLELENHLPPLLKTKYDFALAELRSAISSAVTKKSSSEIDVQKTARTIGEKYFDILMDCKKYEDEYVGELIEPYRLGMLEPNEDIQRLIVEFYARCTTFEVVLYSKIRAIAGLKSKFQTITEEGDELVRSFFNILSSCGKQFPSSKELVRSLLLLMYRVKDVKFLIKHKLIPCIRLLFDDEQDLKDWLVENGIIDLDTKDYKEIVVSFSRTFDLIVEDLQSLFGELKEKNLRLGKGLKKELQRDLIDIGELMEYVGIANRLRVRLSEEFSYDKFGTRAHLNLKSYRIFLNSGGLTSTYKSVLNEQERWLARRNEEGPIGTELEKELGEKIEQTRSLVAKFIGAESSDSIIFTNNTTSSIDLVLRGVLKQGDEVLTTDLEHNVVYRLKEYYEDHLGQTFDVASIKKEILEGKEWLPKLISRIGPHTRLIILSHILFSACKQLPIKEIVKKCQQASKGLRRKMFVLVDGAHAVGNISVNVKDLGCDFYAFDGHKWLLGPEGTGLLYSKEENLEADNPFGVHLPISTAYTVSPKHAPKKSDGQIYELGTADVAKIIGLGEAIGTVSKLRFSEISKWKEKLVKRFQDAIKNTKWRVLNPTDAAKTGMLILQIQGNEENATYEKIVALLGKSNIIVRSLRKPPCIRICVHHFNNERDVELAASHLKALLEGVNVHIGNHVKIRAKLAQIIQDFVGIRKPRDLASYAGLNLFSIAGAGKSYVVSRLLEDLKRKKIIKSYVTIHAKDILKLEKPEKEFALIVDNAWKAMPAVIFIDEADSLLEEKQKGILGVLNDEYNRIMKDEKARIVFITAENDPYKIFQSAARRLKTAYFPLPDFETRLRYLQTLARGMSCSSKLLLTEIARLTEHYSMSDLKKLWETVVEMAEGMVLTPEHFKTSLQLVPRTTSEKIYQKYAEMIRDPNLRPRLFTGEIDAT
ncbi:aminotransferase class V-fold PLP-dependent enzyme [Candidatus Bathyarchaeota archaeon]|nr:aminotransferase class V-fold PLP-dependent enzyme [Candidatus Bathyarchaeota archaeon]